MAAPTPKRCRRGLPEEPWQRFWSSRQEQPQDIYPNSPRIPILLSAGEGVDPVLEVGCGSGRDSVRLAQVGRRVVVLDKATSALAVTRSFADGEAVRLMTVRGDACHLPFKPSSFGTVFHQGVLEHFREPHTILAENRRVLRDGGTLLVDVPQTFHPWTLLKRILIPLGLWFGGWETQFTPRGIAREVAGAGFEIHTVYGEWMDPSLAYRLIRELGRRMGLWRLPLFPRGRVLIRVARALDHAAFGGALERWTGYAVGVVARKQS